MPKVEMFTPVSFTHPTIDLESGDAQLHVRLTDSGGNVLVLALAFEVGWALSDALARTDEEEALIRSVRDHFNLNKPDTPED